MAQIEKAFEKDMKEYNRKTSKSDKRDLLCCPFCGGDTNLHKGLNGMTFILCGLNDDGSDGCGAVVSFRPDLRNSAAKKAYNRRAT